jgi:hypothetical protein
VRAFKKYFEVTVVLRKRGYGEGDLVTGWSMSYPSPSSLVPWYVHCISAYTTAYVEVQLIEQASNTTYMALFEYDFYASKRDHPAAHLKCSLFSTSAAIVDDDDIDRPPGYEEARLDKKAGVVKDDDVAGSGGLCISKK